MIYIIHYNYYIYYTLYYILHTYRKNLGTYYYTNNNSKH